MYYILIMNFTIHNNIFEVSRLILSHYLIIALYLYLFKTGLRLGGNDFKVNNNNIIRVRINKYLCNNSIPIIL